MTKYDGVLDIMVFRIGKMMKKKKQTKGFVLILSMIFMITFSMLAISLGSMSNMNVKIADNQQDGNRALEAAMSGIEYGKALCSDFSSGITATTSLTGAQQSAAWTLFKDHVTAGDSTLVTELADGELVMLDAVDYGGGDFGFVLRFKHLDSDPGKIIMESIGGNGTVNKKISLDLDIERDNRVLKYAVASRGRIWLTSQTVVDGDIYSSWDATRYGSAGIETTYEVVNNGTLSVINTVDELESVNVQMETLDANDNPVFDINGDRVYSAEDTVQGYHEGIEYDKSMDDLPGMDEDDYDTSSYEAVCSGNVIPYSSTIVKEYFPHQEGDYSGYKSGSRTIYRHVYQNQTFTDAFLPRGRNALFKDCTFNGVLFVEAWSYTSYTSRCNNVRFDDCEFNGVIVTDVPKNNSIRWRENCLYFTGGAIFENEWSSQEATILAPNFNINLGNTTELELDQSSELKGAVVGGIVDVRGIVNIDGTIVSMYDTKYHSSGYVTNIGSTDDDGGSEGGAFAGENIQISPSNEQLLPDGIHADIIITVDYASYTEN